VSTVNTASLFTMAMPKTHYDRVFDCVIGNFPAVLNSLYTLICF